MLSLVIDGWVGKKKKILNRGQILLTFSFQCLINQQFYEQKEGRVIHSPHTKKETFSLAR